LWIETAREFSDPVPDPMGERLMLAQIGEPVAGDVSIAPLPVML
jgi:hypothetical protein